jgi:hypothetical protein
MKKSKILITLSLIIITILTGCTVNKNEIETTGEIENQEEVQISTEEKELLVDIKSNSEVLLSNGNTGTFLELSPVLKGEVPENIQYHWIIDNPLNKEKSRPFEMFVSKEQGGTLEIINKGETVEFGVFSQVCYADFPENTLPLYFDIILKVEDTKTLEVLTVKKIIIENRAGPYKIIREEMTEQDKEEELLNTVKRIAFNKLSEEDKAKLDKDISKASIDTTILKEDIAVILDEKYIDEDVYVIDFIGKDKKTLPNNKIVYANKPFCEIVSYGYID